MDYILNLERCYCGSYVFVHVSVVSFEEMGEPKSLFE